MIERNPKYNRRNKQTARTCCFLFANISYHTKMCISDNRIQTVGRWSIIYFCFFVGGFRGVCWRVWGCLLDSVRSNFWTDCRSLLKWHINRPAESDVTPPLRGNHCEESQAAKHCIKNTYITLKALSKALWAAQSLVVTVRPSPVLSSPVLTHPVLAWPVHACLSCLLYVCLPACLSA